MRVDPQIRSILVEQAKILSKYPGWVVAVLQCVGDGSVVIVRMQSGLPGLERVRQFHFLESELALPLPREPHLVGLGVPIPQAGIGGVEGLPKSFLGGSQQFFRPRTRAELAELVRNGLEGDQERGIRRHHLTMKKFQHGMDVAGQFDGKGHTRVETRSLAQCCPREILVTGHV
jgi:hypothetical protein